MVEQERRDIKEKKGVVPSAEVRFLPGTIIWPLYLGWPRRSRMVIGILEANRVRGSDGKPKKVKGLSLWQAVSTSTVRDGSSGKIYLIRQGNRFTAYAKNAIRPENRKK